MTPSWLNMTLVICVGVNLVFVVTNVMNDHIDLALFNGFAGVVCIVALIVRRS